MEINPDNKGSALFFHESTKLTSEEIDSPSDSKHWPESWKEVEYKNYPRFKKIELEGCGNVPDDSLFGVINRRQTDREFSAECIDKSDLSRLLYYSCGVTRVTKDDTLRRAQPSGGGRYPIEMYPIIFRSNDFNTGVYHYDVREHQLETMWERPFSHNDITKLFTYPWVKDAPVAFLLTSVFDRNLKKYGEKGYRHIMIEAGHIGQNLYLVATALGLKCCALAGVRDINVEPLLDIDGEKESVVYGFVLGK